VCVFRINGSTARNESCTPRVSKSHTKAPENSDVHFLVTEIFV